MITSPAPYFDFCKTHLGKLYLVAFLFIHVAAMSQSKIYGTYYFRKQEMVAAFNFSADGKFEFFFSYGAVDRNARGTFSIVGDTVKLNSEKKGGKDFTVTKQSKTGTGYKLQFQHPNKYLLENIISIFVVNGKVQQLTTDSEGMLKVDLPRCDTIYVHHALYPDISTMVKDKKNTNNNFTISLNPSLEQVSFKWLDLIIAKDKLLLMHNYFMPMEGIEFVKE